MSRAAFLLLLMPLGTGCGLVLDDRGNDAGTGLDAAIGPRIDAARARDASAVADAAGRDAGRRDGGANDAGSVSDASVRTDASVDASISLDGGALCTSNADCRVAEHCQRAIGICLGEGRCTTRPTGCPDVHLPVCGCDWVTYGNACEARAAGASIQSEGECVIPVETNSCAMAPIAPDFGICNRCFDDADCGGLFPTCVSAACRVGGEGICAAGPPGGGDCYTHRDCDPGEVCEGAVLDVCLPVQGSCDDP